ncbi:TRAP transporter large permease [Rhizobium rhizogenes]|uniref:TRAP transporter large permease n=1 Tax=Rhizobium rhizogenes TaxID=359 RepID=UPI00157407AF|nr:TRAP transporter large permease subunit [Rhizobium rhizogenes]NTF97913.1 TRAP transporter large permease subunit [Rhizobium rhizogenes]
MEIGNIAGAESVPAAESGSDALVRALDRLNAVLAAAAERVALLAVTAVLLIGTFNIGDIILRNVAGITFYGRNELNALLVAVAVSTCLPIGLAKGSVLSIDMLSRVLSPAARRQAVGLVGLVIAMFFGLLGYRILAVAHTMAVNNQTTVMTEWPKAPFFYTVGAAIMIAAIIQFLIALASLARSRSEWTPVSGSMTLVLLVAIFYVFLAFLGLVPGNIFMMLVSSNRIVFSAVAFALMWVAILVGVPLGIAMGLTGLAGAAALIGLGSTMSVLGSETTSFVTQDALSVLPLFLLMGAFANVAGIGTDLYRLCNALIGHIRGGLAHASILACAGFGTLTGSSVATQMAIGRIGLAEMRQRGYSIELASGAIAAGGTLGQLFPPSSALILYGVLTEQSIGRLFVGALLPGIVATLLYMATVAVWLLIWPHHAVKGDKPKLREVVDASKGAWSVLLLLGLVLSGIYFGFFTELEGGSVGAIGAFLIAAARGKINRATFWRTMGETTSSLAMMYLLMFGTIMLSFFFGVAGLPQSFVSFMNGFDLTPMQVILCLIACYLVLGTAMDSFAMMVITIPIFVPMVEHLGYDPIWWAIMTVICMEAGQISPPFGLNMFVISSLAPDIPITKVFKGCWPFFASTLVKIALLLLVPALATWLPSTM